jgi:hypothetical protein
MRTATSILALCLVSLLLAPAAIAQDENNPPTVRIIRWQVIHLDGVVVVVYDRDNGVGSLNAIGTFLHEELDEVTVTLEINDPDWQISDDGGGEDEVFYRFRAAGYVSPYPPLAPPIERADERFFPEDEGLGPPPGSTILLLDIDFIIPEFIGKSQARLRGDVSYDVRWLVQFDVSNEQDPENDLPVGANSPDYNSRRTQVRAIESPYLGPVNPPPFANAGGDQTVERDTRVILDGTRTFDSFNVGFNNADDQIFEKDTLVFTWEYLSGPVSSSDVDILQNGPNDATGEVTLGQVGTYVFRLTVDDSTNAVPSTDSVTITVVEEIPGNQAPIARIEGPTAVVRVGDIVTLDGSSSSDPDGDTLRFRWSQTDELGGQLPDDELSDQFQPLSGVKTSTSTWQAVRAGEFFFKLLVSDGEFSDSAEFALVVEPAAASDASDDQSDSASDQDQTSGATVDNNSDADAGNGAAMGCGAGLLPAGLMSIGLLLTQRRR